MLAAILTTLVTLPLTPPLAPCDTYMWHLHASTATTLPMLQPWLCLAVCRCCYTANATALGVVGSAQPCYACAACLLAGARHVAAPPSPTWCLQSGWSALMAASQNGHTAVVQMLLDKGANIDLQSKVSQSLMACTSDES